MEKKRFSVEHIAAILKAGDLGTPVSEVCRQYGISEQSHYRWKKLYGSMEPSEARELREGWDVGKNRLYRLYREENLGLRRKRPWCHVSAVHRHPKRPAGGPNDVWGMNFVADQLADGRRIRTLTIVDLFTRECLGIEVGFSLKAEDVVTALNHLKYDRELPNRISCDNGSEFSGGMMDQWAYSNQVEIDFSRRGKPTDNGIVESFNGRFREECLNTHWFDSINDAKEKIDHWRWDYN